MLHAPGITDDTKVFHSFRHSFIDALRLAGVPGEINIALVGHTDPSVHNKCGAKDKAVRFRHRLAELVASVPADLWSTCAKAFSYVNHDAVKIIS
jgi:hypothetical protein